MYDSMSGPHATLIIALSLLTTMIVTYATRIMTETWNADTYITQRLRYGTAIAAATIGLLVPTYLIGNYSPIRLMLDIQSGLQLALAFLYWLVILFNGGLIIGSIAYAIHAHVAPALYYKADRYGQLYTWEDRHNIRREKRVAERQDTFGYLGGE